MHSTAGISAHAAIIRAIGLVFVLACLPLLSGCGASASGASGVGYVTELDTTHGLASGSPVTYGAKTVGSVTGLGWKLNGDSKVNFEVQNDYATRVHEDSIMVLHADTGPPALDLYSPNPSSPVAAPGAKIDGASSQGELSAMLAARGLSSILGAAGALSSAPSAPGSSPTSPAMTLDQIQRQLAAVQAQAAANGSANTAATAAQLRSLNQQVEALRQEIIKQGTSPQAQQLRDQIDQLAHTLTTPIAPPPPGASSTLVTPRVY
ncbi:MAG TPA: MlaD family protein [Candidatus Binataceae bacterium]|nr:MlaD family protein [Candidatus Binataceae bacterium]